MDRISPTRPVIRIERDWYAFDAKEGAKFIFDDCVYQVIKEDNQLHARCQTIYDSFQKFCTTADVLTENFVATVPLSSFDVFQSTNFQGQLLPAQEKHFRVDVDKTLLYRGALPAGNNNEAAFDEIKLHHKSYGTPTVFVSKELLNFLIQQQKLGAKVSITSTGGWDTGQVDDDRQYLYTYLKSKGLKLEKFDNKDSLNKESYINIGLSQKYRVLGDKDSDGRWNIMIDDQWHQRAGFTHSIPAEQFGMG